ncbi:phosphatidate cytidylyltransferase [Polynucleobacter meluiroseus]|uniref:Phosphatidate cytidylyltransferase n=1 Tax=Polynucleobacter meluiroseus TaxID=1938814 RepID=A0A240E1A6_9BURK|nr:phosphatidate cytidylyltransferase [Polynucleobacter meluiroseus]SNX28291.1 phosphatidate cytidylyltransferase [Polynucleobacter meluiroseus]
MLRTRIITAVVLLAVFLPTLFLLPAFYLGALFLLLIAAAAWEWSRLIAPEATLAAWLYALCCLFISMFLVGFSLPEWQLGLLALAALFWFFIAPFLLFKGMNLSLLKLRFFYSILGLILLPAAWLALLLLRDLGPIFLLSTMALVWVADIGAYFLGKTFGKHKLAAQISPGKTIEGAVGGLALTYLFAFLCIVYLPLGDTIFGAWAVRFGWIPMVLMVTVLTLFSISGDLFESQFKRLAGVKDSSHLLPGHGGVLDRIDALLPVLPIAALLVGLI